MKNLLEQEFFLRAWCDESANEKTVRFRTRLRRDPGRPEIDYLKSAPHATYYNKYICIESFRPVITKFNRHTICYLLQQKCAQVHWKNISGLF
jgi:hypothetical protein